MDYVEQAKIFKVLADKNRLEIIDLLSCGEMCACDILEHFDITQPTLSHHMKQLKDAHLITSWKDGTRSMYALNERNFGEVVTSFNQLTTPHTNCICETVEIKTDSDKDVSDKEKIIN